MAYSYTVCESSETSYSTSASTSNGATTVVTSLTTSYIVRGIAGDSGDTPDKINDAVIGCLAALPQAGISTYYHAGSNTAVPQAVCRSVNVTRDQKNRALFKVVANWSTDPLDAPVCAGAPPTSIADLTATDTGTIGMHERVLYVDKDNVGCWLLPTGSPYTSPVIEKVPTLTVTIVQYESSITYEQMLQRSYVVNSDVYRGQAAGRWMTGEVQAQDYTVKIGGVDTTVAKVTYPVMLAPFIYASGQDVGWRQTQPLVDSLYYDPIDGGTKPFTSPVTNVNYIGHITNTGEKNGAKDPEDAPEYYLHRTQNSAVFALANGGFLQI